MEALANLISPIVQHGGARALLVIGVFVVVMLARSGYLTLDVGFKLGKPSSRSKKG
jgi:hypothetical protein